MLSKGVGKAGDTMVRELELDSGWYSKPLDGGIGAFSAGNVERESGTPERASVSRFFASLISGSPWVFSGGKVMSQLESGNR